MTPPAPPAFDILALGNAIVDVLGHVNDSVIDRLPVKRSLPNVVNLPAISRPSARGA